MRTQSRIESGLEGWLEDSGEISEKEHLPVKRLRFGDTGTALDEKEGRYTLGALSCEGDGKFTSKLTFYKNFFFLGNMLQY